MQKRCICLFNVKEEDGEQTKYFSLVGTTCHFFAGLLLCIIIMCLEVNWFKFYTYKKMNDASDALL